MRARRVNEIGRAHAALARLIFPFGGLSENNMKLSHDDITAIERVINDYLENGADQAAQRLRVHSATIRGAISLFRKAGVTVPKRLHMVRCNPKLKEYHREFKEFMAQKRAAEAASGDTLLRANGSGKYVRVEA
jgi:predicted DNA-binding protein (UPF0251 family)